MTTLNPASTIIAAALIVLAVFWLVFPLLVWSKQKEQIRLMREQLDELREINRKVAIRTPASAKTVSAVRYNVPR